MIYIKEVIRVSANNKYYILDMVDIGILEIELTYQKDREDMPEKFHAKIKKGVKKAHPGYSEARVERETNAVMANIGKGKFKKGKRMVGRTKRGKK